MKKYLMIIVLSFVLVVPTSVFAESADSESIAISGGNNMVMESTQQYPNTTSIFPIILPMIQGGKVGDITKSVPVFAIAAKPYNGEAIVEVLKVVKNIKIEKLEIELLSSYKVVSANTARINPSKIRYTVTYKDSATSWGVGGGAAGSMSAINGATPFGATGTAGILPGYGRSTADPKFIVKFFLID